MIIKVKRHLEDYFAVVLIATAIHALLVMAIIECA
jgi:hypothetical protein